MPASQALQTEVCCPPSLAAGSADPLLTLLLPGVAVTPLPLVQPLLEFGFGDLLAGDLGSSPVNRYLLLTLQGMA